MGLDSSVPRSLLGCVTPGLYNEIILDYLAGILNEISSVLISERQREIVDRQKNRRQEESRQGDVGPR